MRDSESRSGRPVRCAIYTRKSTEEGLDQEFNSLDAQREACAAYILSQKHEGWQLLPEFYDDGGFSGGNMDRPGLKQLLVEVEAGRVDVIVVYKVDRLTRSLADFAKIVEVLDRAGASFVSVTQAFNTTTSMGRLTLNVLLSFAQFEREVTGERIRDKIAASKKKGMWMGGTVPLGYDVVDRKLVVNEAEAATVRHIYNRYIALRSFPALAEELAAAGIRSKERASDARRRGGVRLGSGALAYMVANRVYLGEVRHRRKWFAGEHAPIVSVELWEAAARTRREQLAGQRTRLGVEHPSLLAGLLYDHLGRPMVPDHATKGTRRYRYYASRKVEGETRSRAVRLPAHDIEQAVVKRLRSFLLSAEEILPLIETHCAAGDDVAERLAACRHVADALAGASAGDLCRMLSDLICRVDVLQDEVRLIVKLDAVISAAPETSDDSGHEGSIPPAVVSLSLLRERHGRGSRLVTPERVSELRSARSQSLIQLVVKAHAARLAVMRDPSRQLEEIAAEQGVGRTHLIRLLRLAYLAPELTAAAVEGRAPATCSAQRLLRAVRIPDDWREQMKLFAPAR